MTPILLALLSVAAADGTATPRRLAVLPSIVEGPHGRATTQAIYDATAKTSAWRLGLESLSYNELFIDGTEPTAKKLRACGSEASCLARVMKEHGIDAVLTVIVNFTTEPALVTFGVIEGATGQTVHPDLAELGEAPLAILLARRAAKVLDAAGFERAGEVSVTVQPVGAAVRLPGAEIIRKTEAQVTFRAKPGRYTVSIDRKEHVPATREVEITDGETTSIDVILDPVIEEATLVEKPWFWAVVGAAAAGAAVTAVLVATSGPGDTGCLCVSTAGGPCGTCGP